MKAMIFAAGYGKRLHPLTLSTPKPLIKIQRKPIIELIINNLVFHGINDIVINTHHLHRQIEAFFREKAFNTSIKLVYEPRILGTGGGLYNTLDFWNDGDFFVCNADILCSASIEDFINHHRSQGSTITLATNSRESSSMLLIDEEKNFVGLQRGGEKIIKQKPKGVTKAVGFTGYHLISPTALEQFSEPVSFSIIDEYMKLLDKQILIKTWDIGDVYWEDIGTREALENANRHFPGFNQASS